jgi:hypothetical protein
MKDDQLGKSALNGGPAFPIPAIAKNGVAFVSAPGMTLRDYFAAKAMQCLPAPQQNLAELAYKIADAMLKEREK